MARYLVYTQKMANQNLKNCRKRDGVASFLDVCVAIYFLKINACVIYCIFRSSISCKTYTYTHHTFVPKIFTRIYELVKYYKRETY